MAFPLQGKAFDLGHFERQFDVSLLHDAPADAVLFLIACIVDDSYVERSFLPIPVCPLDTLLARAKAALTTSLDPTNKDHVAAYRAMITHLKDTEMAYYPKKKPELGEAEWALLDNMFAQGRIQVNGLFVVGRGYQPCLDGIQKITNKEFKCLWTN